MSNFDKLIKALEAADEHIVIMMTSKTITFSLHIGDGVTGLGLLELGRDEVKRYISLSEPNTPPEKSFLWTPSTSEELNRIIR